MRRSARWPTILLLSMEPLVFREALPPGFTLDPSGVARGLAEAPAPASPAPLLPAAPYPDMPGWPVAFLGGSSPPAVADLDPAYPGLEVLTGTLSSAGNVWAFHADGTSVPGWSVDIGFFVAGSPTVADLDSDGDLEVVVGDFGTNQVWVLRNDGTAMSGWPIAVGANVRSTAAVADLDPAFPGLEFVIGVQDGSVQAWHYDGTAVPGWPVIAGNFVERCSPAVGDVDGDGDLEVFVGSWDTGVAGSGGLYGFDQTGAPLPGWPVLQAGTVSFVGSPALADLDGDDDLEIIDGTYETNARMFVWHHDGTVMSGWPRAVPRSPASASAMASSPAVGDLDGNGDLEIVIGTMGQCGVMHAWHHDGVTVSGWPAFTNAVVDGSSPVVGDVDGGGDVEVVVGSGSGFTPSGCTVGATSKVYVFKANGAHAAGWPIDLGTAAVPNPGLWDLDGDGDTEILLSWSNQMWAWDAPALFGSPAIQWPFYHFDVAHTGRFVPTLFTDVGAMGAAAGEIPKARTELGVLPNPVRAGQGARIRFTLPARSPVEITVFEAAGRALRVLDGGLLAAGPREVAWDGRDSAGRLAPSGVYFVRIRAGAMERATKVTLVR